MHDLKLLCRMDILHCVRFVDSMVNIILRSGRILILPKTFTTFAIWSSLICTCVECGITKQWWKYLKTPMEFDTTTNIALVKWESKSGNPKHVTFILQRCTNNLPHCHYVRSFSFFFSFLILSKCCGDGGVRTVFSKSNLGSMEWRPMLQINV